ncbi:DUF4224 domain-containing protein [Acidovorax sp. Root70]|uniref:DUF4224 domain-containing protein n=1 Tax=Acidovorax sp. Root70 TaxID=1736590 RepID=UPI000701A20D|nr:DUF4224 domain-containing protein [Acidovorax sp. Root70]KRB33389.1 hypothetical protein ASD94_22055 [Acidovorax sp. Root70]
MTIALTDEEVGELTKPIKQGAAQVRHLRELLGCEIKRRPDGRPIVTRDMLARLQSAETPASNDTGLNWGTG